MIKKYIFSFFKEEFKRQEEWIQSSLISQARENSDTEARMDVLEKQFLEIFKLCVKPTNKESKMGKRKY